MKRCLTLAAALAFLVFSGLVHGLWTDRWQKSAALEQALERVQRVPLHIGAWRGEGLEGDADAFRRSGAQRYWVRQYRHPRHKTAITVILMCGRAGRMSVHTPEVCYRGAGYEMGDAAVGLAVTPPSGPDGTLWTAKFTKTSRVADLRLYWAWNGAGRWEAAQSPRWHFRGLPFLYKLYVIREEIPPLPAADALMRDFLEHLLPALHAALFAEI